MNFLPAEVLPERAPEGRTAAVTVGIRPEALTLVGADDGTARLQARVTLVEPLGAKDIVHLELGEHPLRAIGSPGRRPRVGENVGVVVDEARLRYFDDATGLAVR